MQGYTIQKIEQRYINAGDYTQTQKQYINARGIHKRKRRRDESRLYRSFIFHLF